MGDIVYPISLAQPLGKDGIEDGKYERLIEKGGVFADLVERQRLDK